jgi:DNA-binding ferritin-like protein
MSKNPEPFNGYIERIKQDIVDSIDKIHERQVRIGRAMFNSFPQNQRADYCKELKKEGFTNKEIEEISGKSQPTVNRLLNK